MPFERLTVGEYLGKGNFGVVHKASLDGVELALKRTNLAGLPTSERQQLLKSVRRDCSSLKALAHENVVKLFGVVLSEVDSVGLLVELATRGSLRRLLDETPTEVVGAEAVQLRLAMGIAAGMAYLHSKQVYHHDLKSANILLFEADGSLLPKLTDFGLAVYDGGSSLSSLHSGAGVV